MRPAPEHKRVPTRPERLAALIEARRHTPFAWGTHDCCLFAADAVLATTGADPAAEWRGRYDSEAEALELLGARGLEGTVADAMAAFGAPECPVLAAQRGDVVLATSGNERWWGSRSAAASWCRGRSGWCSCRSPPVAAPGRCRCQPRSPPSSVSSPARARSRR
jgi:hypothetical protein